MLPRLHGLIYTIQLSLDSLRFIIGFLIRHCRLNEHLYRMGLTESTLYRGCQEEETAEHVLRQCQALVRLRAEFLGHCTFGRRSVDQLDLVYIWAVPPVWNNPREFLSNALVAFEPSIDDETATIWAQVQWSDFVYGNIEMGCPTPPAAFSRHCPFQLHHLVWSMI